MCGRFTNRLTWQEIVQLYRLAAPMEPERNLPAHYNICPTDTINAVVGSHDLIPVRWGLVPYWWKKPLKELPATFNARAETVADKPMFRDAFKRRRCLIPASGYFEWRKTTAGKQLYYFTPKDGSPLTFAGLWEGWTQPESGTLLFSCTIIVTAANDFVRPVHDRMPALLQPEQFDDWLTAKLGPDVLRPAPDGYLTVWPVSTRVNSSRASDDDPTLFERE
jgi:putative SOS response-associated peptidase YedK